MGLTCKLITFFSLQPMPRTVQLFTTKLLTEGVVSHCVWVERGVLGKQAFNVGSSLVEKSRGSLC